MSVLPSGSSSRTGHDVGLLLLRVGAGGFMLPHGLGKLFGWFDGPGLSGFAAELQHFGIPSAGPFPLLLALSQSLLGVLVVLGLWTRLSAAFAAAFIAGTVVLNVPNGWFWMSGGIEYSLLWTVVLTAISLFGAGRFSIDDKHRAVSPRARPNSGSLLDPSRWSET